MRRFLRLIGLFFSNVALVACTAAPLPPTPTTGYAPDGSPTALPLTPTAAPSIPPPPPTETPVGLQLPPLTDHPVAPLNCPWPILPTELIFSAARGITALDPASGQYCQIETSVAARLPFVAQASPLSSAGPWVAYTLNEQTTAPGLVVLNLATGERHAYHTAGWITALAWLPNSTDLLVQAGPPDNALWVVAATTGVYTLERPAFTEQWVALAPDGQTYASLTQTLSPTLSLTQRYPISTSQPVNLSQPFWAAWRPEGAALIVLTAAQEQSPTAPWCLNVVGAAHQVNLQSPATPLMLPAPLPAWSANFKLAPTGQQLVYVEATNGLCAGPQPLCVYDFTTQQNTCLNIAGALPSWSPSGEALVFLDQGVDCLRLARYDLTTQTQTTYADYAPLCKAYGQPYWVRLAP